MPKPSEVAEIMVKGKRYSGWQTVSVTKSGLDLFPKAEFTAASPIESNPNWADMKLGIGDPCEVILGGVKALEDGRIIGRNPAYDANQHGLQLSVSTKATVIARSSVDHNQGEYKGYTLSQIFNSVLKPYGLKFTLKGDTSGMDKVFPKAVVQFGETVFDFMERHCRARNVYLLPGGPNEIIGYRLDSAIGAVATLQEGRNILSASARFDYTGALSQIDAHGQRPGNDELHPDQTRETKGSVQNPAVKEHAPYSFAADSPGDDADMRMRAQHENGYLLSDQVQVQIVVQGWFKDDKDLWIDQIGKVASVYSPMLFTNDRMNLAIQSVTSTQGPTGTLSAISLVLPEAFNGTGQIDSGGTPAGLYT